MIDLKPAKVPGKPEGPAFPLKRNPYAFHSGNNISYRSCAAQEKGPKKTEGQRVPFRKQTLYGLLLLFLAQDIEHHSCQQHEALDHTLIVRVQADLEHT